MKISRREREGDERYQRERERERETEDIEEGREIEDPPPR